MASAQHSFSGPGSLQSSRERREVGACQSGEKLARWFAQGAVAVVLVVVGVPLWIMLWAWILHLVGYEHWAAGGFFYGLVSIPVIIVAIVFIIPSPEKRRKRLEKRPGSNVYE